MKPLLLAVLICLVLVPSKAEQGFTRMIPVARPKIVASSEEYPGGSHSPGNLIDGKTQTEYSSNAKGTETFVELDFESDVSISAFRHQDRNDPATVAASELVFLDRAGAIVGTNLVRHVNARGGVTLAIFDKPVLARRVRWHVTRLGPQSYSTVGGAEIAFFSAGQTEATPTGIGIQAQSPDLAKRHQQALLRPLNVTLENPYQQSMDVELRAGGLEPKSLRLGPGSLTTQLDIPAVDATTNVEIQVAFNGGVVQSKSISLAPVRKRKIYIVPHSHTDIGYTEIQTEIEDKQVNNLLAGIEYAQKTAGYPAGARFVWNVEVLWAADLYLNRLNESQRAVFIDAVKKGQVCLCGMYLNELTGLCRPEELVRLFRFSTQISELTGVPVDSAMISDVPGYTWGTVPAMSQAGIRYFSVAPNYFDRIGDILVQWENKPFYWAGPSGKDKVLVWIPYKGYAMSHIYNALTPEFVDLYLEQLRKTDYPYDVAYMRWAGHGDNATPDPAICEFVKDWSADHEWPKFVISSVGEAFRALESRHGTSLPTVRGDWTPYWEDGAGASALETGMNRASSDRLSQVEALCAMKSQRLPLTAFNDAWRNVLLYSEHTWGAWCSVGEPARRETREQWEIKHSYAASADAQSRDLLSRALAAKPDTKATPTLAATDEIDVINTLSWVRSDIVLVPKYLSDGRDRVEDDQGHPVPTQRVRSGELAFVASDVPPFGSRRYKIAAGQPLQAKPVSVDSATIDNGKVRVRVNEATGALSDLCSAGLDQNFADVSGPHAINDYLYLVGDNTNDLQHNGPVKISRGESGPVVASLVIQSDAPGAHKLWREVRLVAGSDEIELINTVDKQRLLAASYMSKSGKESVNFAFPFNVPDGQMQLEVPFGLIKPDADQIPGSCKNWFTVDRWADVSNDSLGITWITLDAPLVQVGGITATLLNSQTNPDVWRKKVGPTQKLYSWAMNNHWGTNYRAYQEGPVVFRFILYPHRRFDPAESSRRAIAASHPLLVSAVSGGAAPQASLLRIDSPNIIVTALKPSDDGKALIVRLWEASGHDTHTQIHWLKTPKHVSISDTAEKTGKPVVDNIDVPAWALLTLRAEM